MTRGILGRILAGAAALAACRAAPERAVEEKVPSGTIVLTPAQVQSAGIRADTVRLEMVSLPLVVPATLETPNRSPPVSGPSSRGAWMRCWCSRVTRCRGAHR